MDLKPYDGMTVKNSTPEDRKEVLEHLQGQNFSLDSVKHGFYIGELSNKPVADYSGDMVKREITMMEFQMG